MVEEKDCKVNRILDLYDRLMQGESINKKEEAEYFNVNPKTIQRDIEDIRMYLADNMESKGDMNIEYVRRKKRYCITKKEEDILTREDVLAISKILLESRAFCKDEINHLVKSILREISSEQRKAVEELIGNELFNFVPLQHNGRLLSKLWELSEFIRNKEIIEINYAKTNGREVQRILKPVAIIFSEYYFYLIAYFNKSKYDDPVVFRVDRIKTYKKVGEKFHIEDSKRFEDGEFRKRVQFMYTGELMKISFEFYGSSIEPVLDRLPTAEVIDEHEGVFSVQAEVYGTGIKMWVLSQGSNVRVTSPPEFVDEIKREIENTRKMYSET
ncbi:helix-turn-helix transcriptional regulator [Hathewaya massiliensis]|uniref:helix-turn-helix transcriptional regulator n=1 Tax=Hathewaya massiliensis TaxID=1964382 RepID=UPI00163B695D|nr:WYL domain-containing protein [Hathewaya massiliensis]